MTRHNEAFLYLRLAARYEAKRNQDKGNSCRWDLSARDARDTASHILRKVSGKPV